MELRSIQLVIDTIRKKCLASFPLLLSLFVVADKKKNIYPVGPAMKETKDPMVIESCHAMHVKA